MNNVLALKECSKNLMSFAHNADAGHINEQNADARKLCDCIEQILLNEIKIREFQGVIPLWQLLERLENANPPCIPLRNNVGAIASIPSLKTPFSKVRGWIRQSLNSNCMDESVQFLIKQIQLINQFYYPEAVLRNENEARSFVAVLRSLRILPFNFTVDDKQLVVLPAWTEKQIASQTAAPPAAASASSVGPARASQPQSRPSFTSSGSRGVSSSSSSGSALDSFFMSVESSLQKVIQKVDTVSVAAAQFITTTLENSNNNNGSLQGDDEGESRAAPAAVDRIDRFLGSSAGGTNVKYTITPFFGSSLKQLVLDGNRCSHANLNPLLGIPNQAVKMINFIGAYVNQPDLFRQRASLSAIHELKLSIEEERPLPPSVDISTVTHVLIQWLNQLPEPLLGYEHFAAMLDCTVNSAALYNKTEQLRNFSLLVQDAPWYCKPLLVKLLSLLNKCIQPEHTVNNKLTTVAISILTTPCLLREYNEQANALIWKKSSSEELDRIMLAAVAAGSSTVEYFIENSNDILQPIKADLAAKQTNLGVKCNRIRALQENLSQPVNVKALDDVQDSEAAGLINALWHSLQTTENLLRVTQSSQTTADTGLNVSCGVTASVKNLLSHNRWEICGFVHNYLEATMPLSPAQVQQCSELAINRLPLLEFNAPHGLIGLQCLVAFLKRYPDKGASILADFASTRKRYCTAPQVVIRLTHFVADALHLLPAAAAQLGSVVDFTQAVPVQTIAKYPAWILLNDELCFQELFDVAMLSFDDAWKSCCEKVELLPNNETYSVVLTKCRKTLSDVLGKNPKSINMVWEIWMNSRVKEQEALANRMPAKRAPLKGTTTAPITESTSSSSNSSGGASSSSVAGNAISLHSTDSASKTPATAEKEKSKSITDFDFEEFVSEFSGEYPNSSDIQNILERHSSSNSSNANAICADSPATGASVAIGLERAEWNVDLHSVAMQTHVTKVTSGITSRVLGGSQILNEKHIQQLESGLPQAFQCYDWKLVYRLSIHGANISTLINKAHGMPNSLLVVRDSEGAVFGALITDYLKIGEKEKYYGNGTIGVWSFVSGTFKFYPWSYRNSYFLLSSKDAIAVGGGGNFAIYLDSDLNKGCSGDCQTFSSPCLSSQEQFVCNSCELFSFETAK